MQSIEKKDLIFIKLNEDEDINDQLKIACDKHSVKTAIVISGIGQLKYAQLGYFKEKGNYSPDEFNKPMEILSITGNICKQENEFLFHLHTVLGDEEKNAIGGHLIKGIVGILSEIVLLKINIEIKREYDEKTGLKIFELE